MRDAEMEFRSRIHGNDLQWRSAVSFEPPSDYVARQARGRTSC